MKDEIKSAIAKSPTHGKYLSHIRQAPAWDGCGMNEKIITCVESCHFCTHSAFCPHFGEDGYACHRYHDFRDDHPEPDYADIETGTNYPPDFFD